MLNPELKITFFSGKGGVGKSTVASAYAQLLASRKKKTLLVSTDPAHSLGNIFQIEIGGKPTLLCPHLWGLEIDPAQENFHYINKVKASLKGLVKSTMVEEVERQIQLASDSPGAEEAALFDAIVSIIIDESKLYDRIVIDTAPTGHAIRLLSLPELMSVWMEGMLKRRKKVTKNYSQLLGDGEIVDDPIYDILNVRKKRYTAARDIILDKTQTAIIFVMIPEKLPLMETISGIKMLSHYNIEVHTLFINKILPTNVRDEFFVKRKQQQTVYIKEIVDSFKDKKIILLPLLAEDISTHHALVELSSYLTGRKVPGLD